MNIKLALLAGFSVLSGQVQSQDFSSLIYMIPSFASMAQSQYMQKQQMEMQVQQQKQQMEMQKQQMQAQMEMQRQIQGGGTSVGNPSETAALRSQIKMQQQQIAEMQKMLKEFKSNR